mgnify:CR=1 FL=1
MTSRSFAALSAFRFPGGGGKESGAFSFPLTPGRTASDVESGKRWKALNWRFQEGRQVFTVLLGKRQESARKRAGWGWRKAVKGNGLGHG